MNTIEKIMHQISNIFIGGGVIALSLMVLLMIINIVIRFFYQSIIGTNELVAYGLVFIVGLGLAYTELKDANIKVDILVSKFSGKTQAIIDSITDLLSFIIFAMVAVGGLLYGLELDSGLHGEHSEVLFIPVLPFRIVFFAGLSMLCVVYVLKFFKSLMKGIKQ